MSGGLRPPLILIAREKKKRDSEARPGLVSKACEKKDTERVLGLVLGPGLVPGLGLDLGPGPVPDLELVQDLGLEQVQDLVLDQFQDQAQGQELDQEVDHFQAQDLKKTTHLFFFHVPKIPNSWPNSWAPSP